MTHPFKWTQVRNPDKQLRQDYFYRSGIHDDDPRNMTKEESEEMSLPDTENYVDVELVW